MKVKELVAKLNTLNPELEVYCCTEEDLGFSKNKNILAMPVQAPYETAAKLLREASGELVLQVQDAENPIKVAIIDFDIDVR